MKMFPSCLFLALAQAVQILSMMESHISSREAEVRTLRQDVEALSFQVAAREEEHKNQVRNLSAQLEEAQREAVSFLQIKKRKEKKREQFSVYCCVEFNAGQT